MSIENDVQVRKGKFNFRAYSFLREIVKIKQENEKLDEACKIDYKKMSRRYSASIN